MLYLVKTLIAALVIVAVGEISKRSSALARDVLVCDPDSTDVLVAKLDAQK
jgi:hypothetical protein